MIKWKISRSVISVIWFPLTYKRVEEIDIKINLGKEADLSRNPGREGLNSAGKTFAQKKFARIIFARKTFARKIFAQRKFARRTLARRTLARKTFTRKTFFQMRVNVFRANVLRLNVIRANAFRTNDFEENVLQAVVSTGKCLPSKCHPGKWASNYLGSSPLSLLCYFCLKGLNTSSGKLLSPFSSGSQSPVGLFFALPAGLHSCRN
jgi:hypothetical protein